MTGKHFKEWAATVPDDAVVETHGERYGAEWQALDRLNIRAVLTPPITMDHVNNLEDIRS